MLQLRQYAYLLLLAGLLGCSLAALASAGVADGADTRVGEQNLDFSARSVLGMALPHAALAGRSLAQMTMLTAGDGASDDEFGVAVALDGDFALVGANRAAIDGKADQGAAYIFTRSGSTWSQEFKLVAGDGVAGDEFGVAVALDGDTVLVGANRAAVDDKADQGAAYVFTRSGNTWLQQAKLIADDGEIGDQLGIALALDGDTAVIGARSAAVGGKAEQGAAYVFVRNGDVWSQEAKLVAGDGAAGDRFGYAVAAHGDTAVIGARFATVGGNVEQGAAYVFVRSGNAWLQQAKLIADDGAAQDWFAFSVALAGDTAVVGMANAEVDQREEQGAAYVFVRNSDLWSQEAKLIAGDGAANDRFGFSVALDGDAALVGTPNAEESTHANQGAAYLFVRNGSTWAELSRLGAGAGDEEDWFGNAVALDGSRALVGARQTDVVEEGDNQGAAYLSEVTLAYVDLALTQFLPPSQPGTIKPGDSIVYGLAYENRSNGAVSGTVISETVPAYARFEDELSSDDFWNCTNSGGPNALCTGTIGSLPANGAGEVFFAVTVDEVLPPGVSAVANHARINDDGAHGPDPFAANNETLHTLPLAVTPLAVSKSVFPDVAQPGQLVTFTIALTTTAGAVSVTLTDTLASGLSFTRMVTGGATFDGGEPPQVRFAGPIAAGASLSIIYEARVNTAVSPGSILFNELIAVAGGEHYAAAAAVTVPRPAAVRTLLLIYVNGDNNLAPHMLDLFHKAEAGAGNPDLVTLLLLDGPENGDAFYYLLQADHDREEFCPTKTNPTCDDRYQMNESMWTWGEATSTYASLKEFVTRAIQAYPADQVLLALVGHGGGWSPDLLPGQPSFHDEKPAQDPLGGLLWDANPGSSLSTAQLGLALRESRVETGRTIDLLYLDACLMAMSEVAYELNGSVNYLLAAENWSWTSFRYDRHLAVDPTLTAASIGGLWIENEASELRGDSGGRVNYPFTYSLLDLRQMNLLMDKENALANALIAAVPAEKERIHAAFAASECFDGDQDYVIGTADYYCDLFSFAQQLQEHFGDGHPVAQAAQEVDALLTASVLVAEDHNDGRPWRRPDQLWAWESLGGMSIYLPLGEDDWKRVHYNSAHLRAAADGRWDEFLEAYWATAAPPSPPACSPTCAPLGPEPLRIANFLPIAYN